MKISEVLNIEEIKRIEIMKRKWCREETFDEE